MAIRPFFETPIEYLKGVGPQRAELLKKELDVHTFGELIQYYPFRHDDRTRFFSTREIHDDLPFVQLKGRITDKEILGAGPKKRLVATFTDGHGEVELIWFQGINWISQNIKPGVEYVIFGKPSRYGSRYSIAHPELDAVVTGNAQRSIQPVYPLTEKMRARHFDSKALSRLVLDLLSISRDKIRETLPQGVIEEEQLLSKRDSLFNIHFPEDLSLLTRAKHRLKFEELFYVQLRLLKTKALRRKKSKAQVFNSAALVTEFYNNHLPFALTEAQKRVIREIYGDM